MLKFTHLFIPLFTPLILLCPACLPPFPSSLSNTENTTIIRPSADPSCQEPSQNDSCVNACNLYDSTCPTDSNCIWIDQLEGEIIAQCIAELPSGTKTQGEACHLAQNYWGDCQTDQICMSLFTETLSCMSICDSKNLSEIGRASCRERV
jgi:hypothetical protein